MNDPHTINCDQSIDKTLKMLDIMMPPCKRNFHNQRWAQTAMGNGYGAIHKLC